MPKSTARSLLASGAVSASGAGSAVDLGADTTVDVTLAVTAVSGTLDVFVETSLDGALSWTEVQPRNDAQALTRLGSVTAPSAQLMVFPDCNRFVRVRWVLAGTATFGVTANSIRVYAKTTDVPDIAKACNCKPYSSERLDRAIRAITDKADSAFIQQGPIPLDTWNDYVRSGVGTCAAVDIIVKDDQKVRQKDEYLFKQCADFDEWLDLVALGKRGLPSSTDPTPTVDEGGAYAVTDEKRGW